MAQAPHRIETLDEAGRRIRVGPGDPTAQAVLEYAALLIETEGWNDQATTGQGSASNVGWTLHDSIGEACRRLSATQPGSRGSKDAVYQDASGLNVSLREGAQDAVDNELRRMAEAGEWTPPQGGDMQTRPDYTYNDDPATTQDDVLAVLRRAREAV